MMKEDDYLLHQYISWDSFCPFHANQSLASLICPHHFLGVDVAWVGFC